ncbi:MAG: AAA family ATPase [Patescibacteria group bacterium]|nr:AAA family ATPase [Patescibacteria group bacterium]
MLACFQDILGHEAQKAYLSRVIEKDSLAHAYCFSGINGIGKALIAERITEHFLGKNIESQPNAQIISRIFDEKANKLKTGITVQQIRALNERLSMSSFGGGKKIVIIHDADRMTAGAQNALLKTLEEPLGDTHIFLLAEDSEQLLPTILSRSVHLHFSRIPRESICKLARVKGLSKDQAHALAGIADGRPEVVINLLDDDNHQKFTDELAVAFSFIEEALPLRLRDAETIAKAAKERSDVERFVWQVERILHDVLLNSLSAGHIVAFSDSQERLHNISSTKTAHHWMHALRRAEDVRDHLQKNGNATIALEYLSLSI